MDQCMRNVSHVPEPKLNMFLYNPQISDLNSKR